MEATDVIIGTTVKIGLTAAKKMASEIQRDIEKGASRNGEDPSKEAARESEKILNDSIHLGAEVAKSVVSEAWGRAKNVDMSEDIEI